MTTNALIVFEDDDLIRAAETNDNNRYLENKINEVRTTLNAYLQSQISTTIANFQNSFQNSLYPVGSIYIGTTENCPLESLFGTWQKVSEGRVLQGADSSHEVNTTIAAGLPNITGSFGNVDVATSADGAFYITYQWGGYRNESENASRVNFDASRSSSIYGNSTTVQPPAYVVNIWRRIE